MEFYHSVTSEEMEVIDLLQGLSNPVTMMEFDFLYLDQSNLILSNKLDGVRGQVVKMKYAEYHVINERVVRVIPSSDQCISLYDVEFFDSTYVILDVLAKSGRWVMDLPLNDRLYGVVGKCQQYSSPRDFRYNGGEGIIIQSALAPYSRDMEIFKIKKKPTIDVLMEQEESELYEFPYMAEYKGEIVELDASTKAFLRVRKDKDRGNSPSIIAREVSESRMTLTSFFSMIGVSGYDEKLEIIQDNVLSVALNTNAPIFIPREKQVIDIIPPTVVYKDKVLLYDARDVRDVNRDNKPLPLVMSANSPIFNPKEKRIDEDKELLYDVRDVRDRNKQLEKRNRDLMVPGAPHRRDHQSRRGRAGRGVKKKM